MLVKILNSAVAATFACVVGFAVYDHASQLTGSLSEASLAVLGMLTFVAFVVVAWFAVEARSRTF